MKILLTFATKQEFGPWRRRREFRLAPHSLDGREYVTEFSGGTLHVFLTGIALKTSRAHLAQLMRASQFDCVISTGLVGAVKPQHHIGEILAARETCGEGGTEGVQSDSELLRIAAHAGAKVVARFCTAAQIAVSAAEKHRWSPFADAVETEGWVVLTEASSHGAKAIAIRAVSDEASQDLPVDFNRAVSERGQVRLGQALSQVVKNPSAVPSLVRFGRQSWRASWILARFLDQYVEAIARASARWEPGATPMAEQEELVAVR